MNVLYKSFKGFSSKALACETQVGSLYRAW